MSSAARGAVARTWGSPRDEKYRSSRNAPARFLLEGFVGRRDDSTSTLIVLADSEALDLAFLQGHEDLGLCFQASCRQFRPEVRAAVRLFELADLLFGGPCKRSFLVSEQPDSIRSSGIAAQLTWMNRSRLRRLLRGIMRETSSFPTTLCLESERWRGWVPRDAQRQSRAQRRALAD